MGEVVDSGAACATPDLGLGALMDDRAGAAVGGGRPEVRANARHQRDDPAAARESHEQGWVPAREPVSLPSSVVGAAGGLSLVSTLEISSGQAPGADQRNPTIN